MKAKPGNKMVILKNPGFFFPFRLIIDYLKYNRLLLLSWLLPFLFVTTRFGEKFGIPTLFLTPEYMGRVSAPAFFFTGIAVGSFIMAFHIASYVVLAHRYPTVVTFSRPFYRYALNNSLIPFLYIVFYLINSAVMLRDNEMASFGRIAGYLLIFLAGIGLFIYFSFGFFYFVVRILPRFKARLRKLFRWDEDHKGLLKYLSEKDADKKINESPWDSEKENKVWYYLYSLTKVRRAGKYSHFSKQKFKKVFQIQHINALSYVVFVLSLIVIRGLIKDVPSLILPAGASFHILFTVYVLVISLLYIVFKEWTVIFILILLVLTGWWAPFNMMKYDNSAYGMNYSKQEKTDLSSHGDYTADSLNTIGILNRWKAKNVEADGRRKPPLIIISASGGGIKLSVWTYYALGYVDSLLNGDLLRHTGLITGASGGMLGAAFLRENYLRYQQGKEHAVYSLAKADNLSKDLLNPIFYTYSMSDWFFRLQSFRYNHKRYFKDRAYVFEQTIIRNVGDMLDKPLISYRKPVTQAVIPMLIMSPSVENTGSRMFISSVNVSYLTKSHHSQVRNIEFRHNYAAFDADSLRYLSAIRMNATFPWVSPDVRLPGTPKLYIIDAGLNDNFGLMTAHQFITGFKEWIQKNTSGVVLIKLDERTTTDYRFLPNHLKSMLRPLGSIFSDWIKVQEDNYTYAISSLKKMLPGQFEMITFYLESKDKHVPLSWNITKKDKQLLFNSIKSPENRQNIEKLKRILRR